MAATAESASLANMLQLDVRQQMLLEMALATLVVVFAIVFVFGVLRNRALATTTCTILGELLAPQFARLGNAAGETVIKDGQAFYWFYATGRRYTTGLIAMISMSRRMDLFDYTSSALLTAPKDRVTILLPLSDDVVMEPMSMFLVRRKELSRLRQMDGGDAVQAVEALAGQVVEPTGVPADFVVMTEHADVVSALLPDAMRKLVTASGKYLQSVHVTENGAKWDKQTALAKRLVRVELSLPVDEAGIREALEPLVALSMHLVDACARVRLSAAAKKKGLELRKRLAAEEERILQKQRREELEERRIAKKREEEAAVGKMSRAKQAKFEEKKRKKELKDRLRKLSK